MVLRTSYVVLGLLVLTGVVAATAGGTAKPPRARASATCDDYPNQAAAQRAADTRDGARRRRLLPVAAVSLPEPHGCDRGKRAGGTEARGLHQAEWCPEHRL
jgi:hypothetical protein